MAPVILGVRVGVVLAIGPAARGRRPGGADGHEIGRARSTAFLPDGNEKIQSLHAGAASDIILFFDVEQLTGYFTGSMR